MDEKTLNFVSRQLNNIRKFNYETEVFYICFKIHERKSKINNRRMYIDGNG